MVKQVLKRRTKEVDNEDIVKTLLAEVVYIRNSSYSTVSLSNSGGMVLLTYGIQPKSCMFYTRLLIVEHRSYGVPMMQSCEC